MSRSFVIRTEFRAPFASARKLLSIIWVKIITEIFQTSKGSELKSRRFRRNENVAARLAGSNLKSSSVQCLAQKRLNDVGQSQKQVWNQQQTFYTRTHPPTPFRSRALGWVAGLSHEPRFHLLAVIIMLRNHDCGRCSLTWSWSKERFFKIPQKIFCLIDFE